MVQSDLAGTIEADVALALIDRETLVASRPAATVVGVKLTVEADGIPLAVSVTAAGKVVLPMGVTTRLYVATPPG